MALAARRRTRRSSHRTASTGRALTAFSAVDGLCRSPLRLAEELGSVAGEESVNIGFIGVDPQLNTPAKERAPRHVAAAQHSRARKGPPLAVPPRPHASRSRSSGAAATGRGGRGGEGRGGAGKGGAGRGAAHVGEAFKMVAPRGGAGSGIGTTAQGELLESADSATPFSWRMRTR
jgi:hypothetical protein